ncbi:MAG: putative ArsR family transcriptional regulator [Phycisphaerales bacterium]|jgi:predicted ArsR family transcriptional regulator
MSKNQTQGLRAEQLRVLASPVRIAIHLMLINQGEASVKEIGEQLGRSVPTLYRHLDELEQVGLIRASGTRGTRTRHAKLYSAVNGRRFKLLQGLDTDELVGTFADVVKTQTRQAAREISSAMQRGDAATTGKRRSTHFTTQMGWLTNTQLEELNTHLAAIDRLFDDAQRGPGRTHIATTVVVRPPAPGRD